jgi:dipeptidyl aminopeptidase/acylaminoacyl peptidase
MRVVSRNSIAATLLAAVVLCLLAAPGANAAYPGRPGVIVFSLTFHEGNESGAGGTETGGLYALHPGTSTARPLTNDPKDFEPSFAPSGKKVAFVRSYGLAPGRPYPLTSIDTLDLRTGVVKELTTGYDDFDPSFGPGGMIVFTRYEPISNTNYLVLRTADGRLHRLTHGVGYDHYPVFTPNGRRIIFARDREGLKTTVISIRPDGRGLRVLGHQTVASDLDISPDGRLLAFTGVRELPNGQRSFGSWTWPVSGGPLRLIASSGLHPAFSPSGRKIVYSNDAGLWLRPAHRHGPAQQIFQADYEFESGNGALAIDPTWQPLR